MNETENSDQGMGCEGACEMTSKTCVRSACARAVFPLVTPTHVRLHIFTILH